MEAGVAEVAKAAIVAAAGRYTHEEVNEERTSSRASSVMLREEDRDRRGGDAAEAARRTSTRTCVVLSPTISRLPASPRMGPELPAQAGSSGVHHDHTAWYGARLAPRCAARAQFSDGEPATTM